MEVNLLANRRSLYSGRRTVKRLDYCNAVLYGVSLRQPMAAGGLERRRASHQFSATCSIAVIDHAVDTG